MSIVKILGIGSSPRKGGNSDILLRQILKGAKNEGIIAEEVQRRYPWAKPVELCPSGHLKI